MTGPDPLPAALPLRRAAARPVRVYRLAITYPEGSGELGWQPDGWDPEETPWTDGWFRWPAERTYLSLKGARFRAGQLEKWGAKVTVEPSLPVEWPAPPADGAP